ncbi:MAG TPA: hypothetical protein VN761_09485 [Candidatus Polarisedimenticolia bacterium]|nr:hypothetical protein [Candidatus Polarisedimenticolia bacterium]
MAARKQHENATQRLAKGVRKTEGHARPGRTRKNSVRKVRSGNTRRTLADERAVSPLAKLLGALGTEKIRFQIIGMTAANLQGVPGSTIDVDLWLDLPARQYMKAVNIAVQSGAQVVRNTVVELVDGTLVNFVYEVTGLPEFARVIKKARKMKWNGMQVAVLPLELIKKSKAAIRRPKDLLHIKLIEQRLAVIRKTGK